MSGTNLSNQTPTSVFIKDSAGNQFVFRQRELPSDIPFPMETKVNEIEYPGGHKTNQIIGVYWRGVEWSGIFYGSYVENGKTITAWHRLLDLQKFLGKVVTVRYPVPGYSGFTQEYVIKKLEPKVKNYLHIEYTIELVPHENQTKVKPIETTKVGTTISITNISLGLEGIKSVVKNDSIIKSNVDASIIMGNNDKIIKTIPSTRFRNIE